MTTPCRTPLGDHTLQNPLVTNEQGNTPLHWAALNGHAEAARLLLAAGASPSALNRWGACLPACPPAH